MTDKISSLVPIRQAHHTREVFGVAVSADGRCAVSASLDTTLKVWDVETGRNSALSKVTQARSMAWR